MDLIWIGYLAALLTSTAFIPQLIKSLKTKETSDLSLPMLMILNFGFLLWLIYGFFRTDSALIIANIVSLSIGILVTALKIKYT